MGVLGLMWCGGVCVHDGCTGALVQQVRILTSLVHLRLLPKARSLSLAMAAPEAVVGDSHPERGHLVPEGVLLRQQRGCGL
eukprot:39940-Prorocentrum_minimum.AAC.1